MNFAPVVLFTYNRPQHTRRTIEALQLNKFATETHLIIYSDAASNADAQSPVLLTRQYLHTVQGFKHIEIIERTVNCGLAGSIIAGVSETIDRYGKIIVLEDDMISSPFFLQFMNEALDFYQNQNEVISIHASIYPVKKKLPETFFLMDTGCWGWATWKRGWELFEPDGKKLMECIQTGELQKKFDFQNSYPFTKMLADQINGLNNSWAIRWQASAFIHQKLTLYPGRSLIRNIGHDSTGIHCGATDYFNVPLSDSPILIKKIPLKVHRHARKSYIAFFRKIMGNESLFQRTVIPFYQRLIRRFFHV